MNNKFCKKTARRHKTGILRKILAASAAAVMALQSGAGLAVTAEDGELDAAVELYSVFDGGTGTESNPYLISTEEQLAVVGDLPDYCFKLTKHIEITDEWTPLCAYGDAFTGIFDGDGYTIYNLTPAISNGYKGLFAINNGTIKNVTVQVFDEDASYGYAGGIAGYNDSKGEIEACGVTGYISAGDSFAYSYYDSYYGYVGGLVGYNKGIINECYSKCDVLYGYYAGGLVGYSYGGSIENCYAVCSVESYKYACGLVGYSNNGIAITNSYAAVSLNGGSEYGLSYHNGTVTNSYYDTNVSGCTDTGYGEPKTTLGLKIQTAFTNWDFDTVWTLNDSINDGYPSFIREAEDSFVYAQGIELDTSLLVLELGEESQLTAKFTPSDTTNQRVSWSVDDESVATVSDDGIVTAVVRGTATVTVTSADGKYTAECTVNVVREKVHVTGISLDKDELTLDIDSDETAQLTATLEPSSPSDSRVIWTTSNSAVATVDENGLVTPVAIGTAMITAAAADGGYSASCNVTVTSSRVPVTGISLAKSDVRMIIGDTYTLSPTVLPSDATDKNVTYKSSNTSIATVSSDGVITAKAAGSASITITSNQNSSITAVCSVTVSAKEVAVTGVKLNVSDPSIPLELEVGASLTLTATVLPTDATNSNVIWYSNYSDIATVENGVVTGVAIGTTTVTAMTEDGGYSATCTINVVKPSVEVSGIALKQTSLSIETKQTAQLTAVITPSNADNQEVTYSSANNAIAAVSSTGLVTGISAGTTIVTATSKNDTGTYVAYCTVTVTKPTIAVKSIKLNKSELKMVEGKTTTLKPTINPSNATNQTIIWESSDESVVSVDSGGTLTANAVGEATIAATTAGTTSAGETCTAYCIVTVYAADTPATISIDDKVVKQGMTVPITVNLFANPGLSTFKLTLKYDNTVMYPVSYEKLDILSNVNVTTALDVNSMADKTEVSFVCMTSTFKNFYLDGDILTVNFATYADAPHGMYEVEVEPADFANENYDSVSFAAENAEVEITDYIIGDINDDNEVNLIDAMILGQYLAGYDVTLSEAGTKAAVRIYPDSSADANVFDLQHLMRYLSDWQVELGEM